MQPTRDDWLDRRRYPFTSRFIECEGRRMHYLDEGSGPPILFVHGTPSWSFEWRHAIASLSRSHRCVAPDHLGFGLSDKPAHGAYRPVDHARRLRSLAQKLELRDVVLVVHDFGGPIGLPLALEEPGRVRHVVLANTWMWPLGASRKLRWLSRFVGSPLGRLLYLGLNASPRWLVPSTFADRTKLTPAIHRHYLGPFPSAAERVAPWILGRELTGSDAFYGELWEQRERLAKIPASLIWGAKDPAFTLEYLEQWRAVLPGAPVALLDAGHFPQEEQPDAVTAAIAEAAGGVRGFRSSPASWSALRKPGESTPEP